MIEHIHPEGEPTPTVAELYERHDGSAEVAQWTAGSKTAKPKPSVYRLTDKGYAILGEVMRRNALASLARGSEAEEARLRQLRDHEQKGQGNGRKSAWTPS